jgi:hypothetical protein
MGASANQPVAPVSGNQPIATNSAINLQGTPAAPTNVFEGSAAAMRGAGETYGNLAGFQPSAQQYMNPYTQDVIDRTQQDIMRQQQMSQNQLGAQATQAGAFGGSRHGVAEGVMAGEYGRMAGDIAAQQRQQAYNQALDTAFRTAGVQQAGAAGLGGVGSQLFGQGINIQQQIGQQAAFQRSLEQKLLDLQKAQFGQATGAPLSGLGAMSQIIGGVPYSTSGTATQSQPFNPASLLMLL